MQEGTEAAQASRMTSDVTSPVAVAGPPRIERALERLRQSGQLRLPVRALPLGPEGPLGSGPAAGVQILWRHGRGGGDPTWTRAAIEALPDLAWVHSDFVGIDTLPVDLLAQRHVVVTNGLGNYSRPMAEWVVLAMLAAAKHLPDFVRRSDAGTWEGAPQLDELDGAVALFLGLGSVGALAAAMAQAFGVEVRAVTRSPRPAPPPGVASLIAAHDWRSQLGAADFVVCALPLTPQTRGMVDAAALAAMKASAWLINVARGAIIDEAALVAALDHGQIGGAVLDAFAHEPLPPGHPLWGRPNVLVVPHHTWSSPKVAQRIDALFADQLLAWARGEQLANRVDVVAGY